MKFLRIKKVLSLFLVVGLMLGAHLILDEQTESASLSSVSITLSNARPSFRGALASGNTVGSSILTINTTPGAYPSTSSAQLVEDDTLGIGSAGLISSYGVGNTPTVAIIQLDSVLGAGHADAGDDVISTVSAVLTVRFTTASAVNNGSFRILVPAVANSPVGAPQDGIPDGGGFDFGASAPTVSCPADVGATYDFVTGTATASFVTINSTNYHSYECKYSGTGAIGTAFDSIGITSVINAAPAASHTTGVADSYGIILRHLDTSQTVIDRTAISVGVIEAVKITATVDAQITFKIIPVATSTSVCGITTDVTTTGASVPFGSLSLTTFIEAAHSLSVTTNATSGYAVTAIQNDQLGRNGGACAGAPTIAGSPNCIADAEVGSMTQAVSQDWTTTTNKGMAYALHDANSTTTEAFAYNESARTFSARHFADQEAAESAVTIFSDTAVADNDNAYICYRIIPGTTTAAGDYENYVRYTATATF